MTMQSSLAAWISIVLGIHGRSSVLSMACAESIRHNKVHGNTCETIFENLNITAETRDLHVDTAVSASFGFGGHNAAVMIERYK